MYKHNSQRDADSEKKDGIIVTICMLIKEPYIRLFVKNIIVRTSSVLFLHVLGCLTVKV